MSDQFVASLNIERFEALLKKEVDLKEQTLLKGMIAEQREMLQKAVADGRA